MDAAKISQLSALLREFSPYAEDYISGARLEEFSGRVLAAFEGFAQHGLDLDGLIPPND